MEKLFVAAMLLISSYSWAGYNANMEGVIEDLAVYTAGDYIYVRLENQPASHPGCNPAWFVITEDVPESRRQMLMSRLLMAYASKEKVNIGYDGQAGNCAHGYIRLHRAG